MLHTIKKFVASNYLAYLMLAGFILFVFMFMIDMLTLTEFVMLYLGVWFAGATALAYFRTMCNDLED